MKKEVIVRHFDFMIPINFFDFNNEEIIKVCFSPENLTCRLYREKVDSKTKLKHYKNTKEIVKDELAMLFGDSLFWILKNQGESAFRKVAKYLHISEEEMNKDLKLWKEEIKNQEAKHESDNPNSV
ncbi:MAG: hypothetical protein NT076_05010 [Candidatus Pacearchaeota archaeon]|nr:hypothetical protein [Candidatus Pacearchaeota archaeon]